MARRRSTAILRHVPARPSQRRTESRRRRLRPDPRVPGARAAAVHALPLDPPAAVPRPVQLLAKGSQDCVAASYGLWTSSNGGIEFYIFDGNNLIRSGSTTADKIWDGRWHNLSATYDGTNARLYLDGKSLGEPTGSPSPIVYDMADGTATIGGYRGSCDLLFSGDIDQVMLFDRELPIEQIWERWGFILSKPTAQ